MSAIKVHYNAQSRRSRQLITQFIHEMTNNEEIDVGKKIDLLFLIEKTLRPEPRWAQYSNQLFKECVKDIEAFIEAFVNYESKTLKLTNFVFKKLYEMKVDFSVLIELLGSTNLKLLTSLKGKLLSPLKKYIQELDITKFDLHESNMNSLVSSFKLLFCFKDEIS